MIWFTNAIIAGSTSFIATNIDDIVILMLFFTQINATFRSRHIVIGQYLGFSALIVLSLPGFFGGLILPKAWIGLLGLLPIVIGISHLISQEKDEGQIQAVATELNYSGAKLPKVSTLASLFSPQTYQVAAVTFANGGDNVGIYVPLFASSSLASLGVILVIFFLLIGVWCRVAYQLTRHSAVARVITSRAHRIIPFVLIGLGIFILIECGTHQLLWPFQSSFHSSPVVRR